MQSSSHRRPLPVSLELGFVAVAIALAACSSSDLAGPRSRVITQAARTRIALDCTASITNSTVSCQAPSHVGGSGAANHNIIGGQNVYVSLASSNVAYNASSETFSFDVTVQNLLNEALGSPDGVVTDSAGVKVFFSQPPVATSGTGAITVLNADGVGSFTAANQPYFKYDQKLAHDETSSARNWQFHIPTTVGTFSFTVYVSATVQAMLVINEVLANPGGTIMDVNGEWFEVYNAGTLPVDLEGYVIADSAASGRRPYHRISTSLVVNPGSYVVLGENSNTTDNGGVVLDYAYGTALTLANSLDAVKIALPVDYGFGPDTVTIDRVQYSSPGVSAQNGISRELINPALDNTNMDGSNWADAVVTAVYGPGGRGTPKAQNSRYIP
jgi:hypothetical protein